MLNASGRKYSLVNTADQKKAIQSYKDIQKFKGFVSVYLCMDMRIQIYKNKVLKFGGANEVL